MTSFSEPLDRILPPSAQQNINSADKICKNKKLKKQNSSKYYVNLISKSL